MFGGPAVGEGSLFFDGNDGPEKRNCEGKNADLSDEGRPRIGRVRDFAGEFSHRSSHHPNDEPEESHNDSSDGLQAVFVDRGHSRDRRESGQICHAGKARPSGLTGGGQVVSLSHAHFDFLAFNASGFWGGEAERDTFRDR